MKNLLLLSSLCLLAACGGQDSTVPLAGCPDPLAGCRLTVAAHPVGVRFLSAPDPLKPFVVEVSAPHAEQVGARFLMVGMEMGVNRYRFQREGAGWRASVMLPACVAGRSDWLMELEVDGQQVAVPFTVVRP